MSQAETAQTETGEPEGIGGWLLLPLLHLVLNAGMIVHVLGTSFFEGYTEARQEALAGGPAGLADMLTPALIASLGILIIAAYVIIYAIACLVRFLQKKKQVPGMMISFYILLVVLTGANYFVLQKFPELATGPDDVTNAVKSLVRVAFVAAIWIPYFYVSVRVKNTFVR